jgi:hypothetical protein
MLATRSRWRLYMYRVVGGTADLLNRLECKGDRCGSICGMSFAFAGVRRL